MKWLRVICFFALFGLTILLVFLLIGNPLFFKDILRAISDIKLELTITSLLVGGLLWIGLEVNHQAVTKTHSQQSFDFWQGISTEMIGAVITTVLLGMMVLIFQQYQAIQNRKGELILQMGSPDNATAVEAVRQLNAENWSRDGTLQQATFWRANLQGAYLESANLQRAYMDSVNLQGAQLFNANLQRANLRYANLQGVNLQTANLQEALLPDGSLWTVNTDMTRFTDPNHLDFWNPCTEVTDFVLFYCENQ